jgi:hypothetical protein
VANLLPEGQDGILRDAISKYGEVKKITEEQWSHIYKYPISTGARWVDKGLQKHIPSHMDIVGNRVLITYEDQPHTCYGCYELGHNHSDCPKSRKDVSYRPVPDTNTWAYIVKRGTAKVGNK